MREVSENSTLFYLCTVDYLNKGFGFSPVNQNFILISYLYIAYNQKRPQWITNPFGK